MLKVTEKLEAIKQYTKKHRWEAVALVISSIVLGGLITLGGISLFSPQTLNIFRIPPKFLSSLRNFAGVAAMFGAGGIGLLLGGGVASLLSNRASKSADEIIADFEEVNGTRKSPLVNDRTTVATISDDDERLISEIFISTTDIQSLLAEGRSNGDSKNIKSPTESDVDFKHKSTQNAFVMAASKHSGDVSDNTPLQALLDEGADINAQDSIYGNTALHMAVDRNNVQLVKFLLENKIDVNIQDGITLTAPEYTVL